MIQTPVAPEDSSLLRNKDLQLFCRSIDSSNLVCICYVFPFVERRYWRVIGVDMFEPIRLCVSFLAVTFRPRAALQEENLVLRHQLCVYQRSIKRPKVQPADRILWSLLARAWTGWKDALIVVKPDTVIRWPRKRFKEGPNIS